MGAITGTVTDEATGSPIPFVNVWLYRTTDSSLVKGVVTEDSGRFTLDSVSIGTYYLHITRMGYRAKHYSPISLNPSLATLDLQSIPLSPTDVSLEEMIVTSEQALLNLGIDRKIYQVGKDIVNQNGTTADVLRNVPSVSIDLDGNITLRNSPNVTLMLDGKKSAQLSKSESSGLEVIPAQSIDRIEVITNPSAKYRPEGTAGIINIVLKKDKDPGFNGSLSANTGANDRYGHHSRFNYRVGNYNVYLSMGCRKYTIEREHSEDRQEISTLGITQHYYEHIAAATKAKSDYFTAGFDQKTSRRHQYGLSVTESISCTLIPHRTTKTLLDQSYRPVSTIYRTRETDLFAKDMSAEGYYTYCFSKPDEKLEIEASYSDDPESNRSRYADVYVFPIWSQYLERTELKLPEENSQATVAYSKPISETIGIEIGGLSELNRSSYDLNGVYYDTTIQSMIPNPQKQNKFEYKQVVYQLYGTYRRTLGKFGLLVGLRGDWTRIDAHSSTLGLKLSHEYRSIFPSLHLTYKLQGESTIHGSYSRRMNRPSMYYLNPNPVVQDPHSVTCGNPLLYPDYTHIADFGYQYQNNSLTLDPTIFYMYATNQINSIQKLIRDTVILTTFQNMDRDLQSGFVLNFTYKPATFVDLSGYGGVVAQRTDASDLEYRKKTHLNFDGKFTSDFYLSPNSRLQAMFDYTSYQYFTQGYYKPYYSFNCGYRQVFLDGKLSVTATVNDLFQTQAFRKVVESPTFTSSVLDRRMHRVVSIGVSYRFGQSTKRVRDEQIRYDERS